MILLDTNVVSETMRATPNDRVREWLDAQAASTLVLSSISLGELLLGVAILPAGRRRSDLEMVLRAQVDRIFAGRILPFDETAARAYARVVSGARATGRAINISDGQIAAIAAAHDLSVATRDVAPFAAAGVETIDPWASPI